MFDDSENQPDKPPVDAGQQAIEQSNALRLHAELAAVFEGCRKVEAELKPGLDPDIARQVQRAMARADKARADNNPILPESALIDARKVLAAEAFGLTGNDYHIHRRPGEVMLIRWLAGEQVETFYERLQAHFDAGLNGLREQQRTDNEWKQDERLTKYLEALDAIDVKLADRYLRQPIREHDLVVLSTQTADEINISYLVEHVMGVEAADVVGRRAAPGDAPTEADLAWFFKLFLLRGMDDGVEAMCFFAFLQKTNDDFDTDAD